jgi:hypothetical protein
MQSPSPGSLGGEKWPKVTGTLFYYERFLKICQKIAQFVYIFTILSTYNQNWPWPGMIGNSPTTQI